MLVMQGMVTVGGNQSAVCWRYWDIALVGVLVLGPTYHLLRLSGAMFRYWLGFMWATTHVRGGVSGMSRKLKGL